MKKAITLLTFLLVILVAVSSVADELYYVLCKPGDYINLRMSPNRQSQSVGFLECGDTFVSDGDTENGFIHVLDRGDTDCWMFAGYATTDEPEDVFQTFVCVAKRRVACRRWIDGPLVIGYPWLKNGQFVDVWFIAGQWAVTNKGFIKIEWLEEDP